MNLEEQKWTRAYAGLSLGLEPSTCRALPALGSPRHWRGTWKILQKTLQTVGLLEWEEGRSRNTACSDQKAIHLGTEPILVPLGHHSLGSIQIAWLVYTTQTQYESRELLKVWAALPGELSLNQGRSVSAIFC